MELYKTIFVSFNYNKLNLVNINDPVQNRAPSSDKGGESKRERCGTNLWRNHVN